MKKWLIFGAVSLAAGAVNGLLGAGGGVIMLYLIRSMLKDRDECAQKDAFASVVAVMLPVSIISAVSYAARGSLDVHELQILTLPALAGGIAGAFLTDRLPARVIRLIFGVLVIISGLRMAF